MEYTGTKEQSTFINGVFDLLLKNNLVKENVHYTCENGMHVWDDKLHNVISECMLEILEAISE